MISTGQRKDVRRPLDSQRRMHIQHSVPGSLHFSLFIFFAFLLSVMAACNEPFNPVQQNNLYPFSIHGYLDASQDTNWVRITAVRDSLFMDTPVPIDAVATLEHLETGRTVTMNDSLFRYPPGDQFAYNFWTDNIKIEPEHTYRLSVRRSDGAESRATVTLPPDFPVPTFKPGRFNRDTLVILNVQNLADVVVTYNLVYHYQTGDLPRDFHFRHLTDTLSGFHYRNRHVLINTRFHFDAFDILIPYTIKNRTVKVSSAGPEWRSFLDMNENLTALLEGTSNVEGGTGYLIGIVSNTIEWPVE